MAVIFSRDNLIFSEGEKVCGSKLVAESAGVQLDSVGSPTCELRHRHNLIEVEEQLGRRVCAEYWLVLYKCCHVACVT